MYTIHCLIHIPYKGFKPLAEQSILVQLKSPFSLSRINWHSDCFNRTNTPHKKDTWTMDNNCVKYHPNETCLLGAMSQTWILVMCVCPLLKVMIHSSLKCNPDYTTWLKGVVVQMHFSCKCSVTYILEVWHWVKAMGQPCIMDNTYVKCYLDLT